VRTAVDRVDVIRERIDLLVVAVVVLDCDLDRKIFTFLLEIDRLIVQRRLVLVQVLNELRNAALVVKLMRTLRLLTLVFDRDPNAFVKKGLSLEDARTVCRN
jgi:hypothetical protein